MSNKLLTNDSPEVIRFFQDIERLERIFTANSDKYRPVLKGERYLTEEELSKQLKTTRRTLIEHRNTGKLPFYRFGGRILYKESDILKILENNRMEAFNP